MSFPLLKKALYDNTLFKGFEGKVMLRSKLKITLKNEVDVTRDRVYGYFSSIERIFSSEIFNGRFAKDFELDREIKKEFKSESIQMKIKEVLLNYYV
jgi:hypothetical protein